MSTFQDVSSRQKAILNKPSTVSTRLAENGNIRALKVTDADTPGPARKKKAKPRKKAEPAASLRARFERATEERTRLEQVVEEQHAQIDQQYVQLDKQGVKLDEAQSWMENQHGQIQALTARCNAERSAREELESRLAGERGNYARLKHHYDGVLGSRAWRITAPLRLARDLAGDVKAVLRFAPLLFRVETSDPNNESSHTFRVTPLMRRYPRGWVRLRTVSPDGPFCGAVRLYFDAGSGFLEAHSVEVPVNRVGGFDVLCKLPRHIVGLQLRGTSIDKRICEIAAVQIPAVVGISTILRHELLRS